MGQRVVTDAIHGSIALTDEEWRVVDTPSFQRLRNLKQLQMAHLTYPNATHTRLAHSLGVFAMMGRVLDAAKRQKTLTLSDDVVGELRLAALLHDVGHYPYSHLMERIDKVNLTEELIELDGGATREIKLSGYPSHEEVGELIVTERVELRDALGGLERAQRVAALFRRSATANPELSKLVHSSLDMDRFDYLLRDANAAGVPYGKVDLHYLLDCLQVSQEGTIGFSHKAISAAEHFLFARFFMHKVVYYHKTTYAFEEACRQLLRRCRDQYRHDVPTSGEEIRRRIVQKDFFLNFTDAFVDRVVYNAATSDAASEDEAVLKQLARCIVDRRPPKLIGNVDELVSESSGGIAERCKVFEANCKNGLADLSRQLNVDPRLFLFTGIKEVTLEKPAPSEEERDEFVKIFEKGASEPRPLVEIETSITHVAAKQAYKFVRLYLVANDDAVVEKARLAVASW